MSNLHICSSQYGVKGTSSVSVVFPGANFAITLVGRTGSLFVTVAFSLSSTFERISAARSALPSAKAAFALFNQDEVTMNKTKLCQ